MNIASLEAIKDWIEANYYSDEEIANTFYIDYTLTIKGNANEVIAIKDQVSERTYSLTLGNNGQGTITVKFLPGDTILIHGSKHNNTVTVNLSLDTAITISL